MAALTKSAARHRSLAPLSHSVCTAPSTECQGLTCAHVSRWERLQSTTSWHATVCHVCRSHSWALMREPPTLDKWWVDVHKAFSVHWVKSLQS